MIFDTHIHSVMSTDGKMSAEEAIKAANESNIGIIFTEHYDADSPDHAPLGTKRPFPSEEGFDPKKIKITPGREYDFRVNVPLYMSEYEKLRSDEVLLGIEIGLSHLCGERNDFTIRQGDFDFVIGSVHMIGLVDIYQDLYCAYGPVQTVTKKSYLNYVLRMVAEYDNYDAFGHIDYPSRVWQRNLPPERAAESEMDYFDFKETYDAILKILAQKEKPLEINTRRLEHRFVCNNMKQILKAYKNSGGSYVTIGSDAHRAEEVGRQINTAYSLARELSLKPVYFKERKIMLIN